MDVTRRSIQGGRSLRGAVRGDPCDVLPDYRAFDFMTADTALTRLAEAGQPAAPPT